MKRRSLLPLSFVFIVGLVVGIVFCRAEVFSPKKSSSQTSLSFDKNSINMPLAEPYDETGKFFPSQVSVPSEYSAITDMMIVTRSDGGMAPPRLILRKNQENIDYNNFYSIATKETESDCIVIWSTNSMGGLESWLGHTEFSGELTEKVIIPVGKRKVEMYRLMTNGKGDRYVAFLPVGNSEDTSYYFYTCNLNNKADFISIISSLKFKEDYTSK